MEKSNFKTYIKALAFILSVLMAFYAVPTIVFADAVEAIENALSSEDASSEIAENASTVEEERIYEEIGLREESVKHFRLEDGSYVAAQYSQPVHIKDADGEWQDIDNTLSDSGSDFSTSNARVKFAKKTTGNNVLFTLHDGNYKIEMALEGANKKVDGQVTNTNTEFDENATELQKQMTLDKLSSRILYPDILDGVDLEYVIDSLNIKENIIVKDKQDSYSYTFTLKLNNLEAELQADGSILVFDPDTDAVVYTIPAPIVYDADYVYADADKAEYTLTDNGNGKFTLIVTVDSSWMNAEDRAFPVVVDPAIVTNDVNNIVDTYIYYSDSMSNFGRSSKMYVGKSTVGSEYISLLKISSMPSLPANAYIVSADIELCYVERSEHQANINTQIGVFDVTTSWSETELTWNDFSDNNLGALWDYVIVDNSVENASVTHQYIGWDITRLAQGWYSGAILNSGIAFRYLGSENYYYVAFSTSHASSYFPTFTVKYIEAKGLETYWTYLTQSVGAAGTGYVNVATGNLVYSLPTMSTSDALFTYMPLLVYNSARANKYNIYANDNNTPYTVSSIGKGWNLSVNETIAKKSYTHNGVSEDYYVWTDGDGTSHDFYIDDAANGIYKDNEGLLLTLTAQTNYIVIEDSAHNKRYYSLYNNGTSNVYAILTSIVDVWGNTLNFALDSSGRVTSISVTPYSAEDPFDAIQYLIFEYENNLLTQITNSATDDYMTFTHSSDGTLTEVRYYYNSSNLYDKYRFGYDSNGRILMAKDVESQVALYYTYDTLGRVQTVHEEYNSSVGQKIGFTYGTGITSVRGSGSDDIYNTTDDLFNHYTFDSLGRVISTYSTNYEGTTIYGASSGIYGEGAEKNNLKNSAVSGSSASNAILNSNFELVDTTGNALCWERSNNVVTDVVDGTTKTVINIQPSTTDTLAQYVKLLNGTYTLSMQISTQNCKYVTLKIKAISQATGGATYEKEIPVSELQVDSDISPNLTFTVDKSIGYENYRIEIEAIGNPSANSAKVLIDNVMLEPNIGSSQCNIVSMGDFEDRSIFASERYSLSDFWDLSNAGTHFMTSTFSGEGFSLDGNVNEELYIKQTINVLPAETWQSVTVPYDYTPANFFRVSAFANGSLQTASGFFGLKVVATCYPAGSATGTNNNEPPVFEFAFPFNNNVTANQYVSGLVTIPEGYYVQTLDVYCIYANHPGIAVFDNISVVQIEDSSAATYTYYESGVNEGKIKTATTPEDSTYYAYNDNGDISFIGTLSGNITRYVYETDEEENPTYILNMQQSGTVIFTPGDGEPISLELYEQNKYTPNIQSTVDYTFDAYGLVTATDAYGASATSGTVKSSTVYNTTNGFKFFGQVQSTTDENNDTVNYVYDSSTGLLTYQVSPDGSSGLYYMYDSRDRLISVEPLAYSPSVNDYYNAAGEEKAAYTYNDRGWLTQISSATTTYEFTYDAYFGNLTSVKAGNYVLATYTYNENNGKIKSMSYQNGPTVTYSYDALDRIEKISYNGVERYTYQYTSDGKLHGVTDVTSNVGYLYEYDDNGQLTAYTQYKLSDKTNTLAINYKYDDKSRLAQAITTLDYYVGTSNMTTGTWVEGYIYDDSTDLLEEYAVSFGHLNGQRIVGTYTYEVGKAQRLASKTYTFGTSNAQSNVISYSYNDQSVRLSSQISQYISRVGDNENIYSYIYDQNGNITRITDTFDNAIRYTYDDLNQLIREDNPYVNNNAGATYVYTYDYNGNRTSKKTYAYTTGTINTNPTDTQTYTYGQNNWGDLLTTFNGVGLTYDAIGNPINYYNGESYTFSWTDGRRLSGASYGGKTLSFTYNDEGIRTSKTVDGVTHYYTLDGSRIISERWGSNFIVYLYDESGAPIGMQYRTETMAEGTFSYFYFEKNLQGDIIAVYNESGTRLVSYTYDAWGNISYTFYGGGAHSAVQHNPFRYRGYYYDDELDLYYLNSRYYDPDTGRFINADGQFNGGLLGNNAFAYCENNPIMYVDYFGQEPISTTLSIAGAALVILSIGALVYTIANEPRSVYDGLESFPETQPTSILDRLLIFVIVDYGKNFIPVFVQHEYHSQPYVFVPGDHKNPLDNLTYIPTTDSIDNHIIVLASNKGPNNQEAEDQARSLGYTRTGKKSHGSLVFENNKASRNKRFISVDNTQHNGKGWKVADKPENLTAGKRTGTYNWDLTIRIKK